MRKWTRSGRLCPSESQSRSGVSPVPETLTTVTMGIGGPGRDRTGDLFHAMEARSQLRHRPTLRKEDTPGGERHLYFLLPAWLSQTTRPSRSYLFHSLAQASAIILPTHHAIVSGHKTRSV